MLKEETKKQIEEIAKKYPEKRSGLLPALFIAQLEKGWISSEIVEDLAKIFSLSPDDVLSVASFYTMFRQRPIGRYHIQICRNISCWLSGSEKILGYIKMKLGIEVGETTKDGMFTLSSVECLASCGTAPAMMVNEQYYENLTEEKVDQILKILSAR